MFYRPQRNVEIDIRIVVFLTNKKIIPGILKSNKLSKKKNGNIFHFPHLNFANHKTN